MLRICCDRCKKDITNETRYKYNITIISQSGIISYGDFANNKNTDKDLCETCNHIFESVFLEG